MAAAADELDRLRLEAHGLQVEVGALQAALAEKDALLRRAVGDTDAAEGRRREAAGKLAEATR